MKKNLKKVLIIILLISVLIPITYSYALSFVEPDVTTKQFFEISKTEVTKNEKVEMIINLDSIKYNEFTFELKSDEVIENLEIKQSDEITTEKNNNEIVMEINKAKTNVETINLFYSIPENKNVGDRIKFIATITNSIENETEEITQETIEVPTENEETTNNEIEAQTQLEETNVIINDTEKVENENVIDEPKQETQSIELEIKIIEEKNDNKQETDSNKIPNKNNASSVASSNNSASINQTTKVVYKGSDNNYLSKLSAKGYTFNREFSKENSTYFITVENDIKKVNITATAQDDNAKICVYGNENLKEGTNKILITVTAENGNVRNYRIYVTRNS